MAIERYGFHFGLEQEFFLTIRSSVDQIFTVAPKSGIPKDNAGYLAEARGEPYREPLQAIYSLKAEERRMDELLQKHDIEMLTLDRVKLPVRVITDAWKIHGIPLKDKVVANLYDKSLTDEQLEHQYAGIHVNISNIQFTKEGTFRTLMFDHVPIIKWLDRHFAKEINSADRLPGSYAVKALNHGTGLEYRSLPTSLSHEALLHGLQKMKKELNLIG